MRSVDTIVTNYKTPQDLAAFLRSYIDCGPAGPGELFVVQVSPTVADRDVTADFRSELKFTEIVFEENVGYARANNSAAHLGESEAIAIFNADVVLTPGAIDRCTQALFAKPEWGVLGPRQVDTAGQITAGGIFGTSESPSMRGWRSRGDDVCVDVRDDAVSVAGSALWTRREVWEALTACPEYRAVAEDALGAFLPTQHYYEETYFCYHARHHGWRCVFYGEVEVIHHWHRASPLGTVRDRDVMSDSRVYFRKACDRHGMEHD